MAVAYKPGQVLTESDLKILIRDTNGNLVDPSYIRYSLFDYTTGVEVLIGAADRIPATSGTGQYYVDATIPLDANIGDWLVRWNFRETAVSPLVQVVQEFNIVAECTTTSITETSTEDLFIRRLRIMLRDNNPDRNYRFRPPSHEKFIQAQTQVFGYIWEDEELYEYLLMAVDLFNGAPPITDITLGNMPTRWRTTIIMRAAGFACAAVAMNWIADEFSVRGDEYVTLRTSEGDKEEEYILTLEEFFKIMYEDKIGEIERQVKAGVLSIIKEFKDEDKRVGRSSS
ncbi:MAG: hypothetical protein GF334_13270 [Candidatus Altiarchaeales archaeon]|nr:hypothetical protein [Candidatus Altiarchaeales archaeon]